MSLNPKPCNALGRLIAMFVLYSGMIYKPIFELVSLESKKVIDFFSLFPLTTSEYCSCSAVLLGDYGLLVIAMVLTSRISS
jgi:hypothetical protein